MKYQVLRRSPDNGIKQKCQSDIPFTIESRTFNMFGCVHCHCSESTLRIRRRNFTIRERKVTSDQIITNTVENPQVFNHSVRSKTFVIDLRLTSTS